MQLPSLTVALPFLTALKVHKKLQVHSSSMPALLYHSISIIYARHREKDHEEVQFLSDMPQKCLIMALQAYPEITQPPHHIYPLLLYGDTVQ